MTSCQQGLSIRVSVRDFSVGTGLLGVPGLGSKGKCPKRQEMEAARTVKIYTWTVPSVISNVKTGL